MTSEATTLKIDQFLNTVRSARCPMLLLDYDGTLAPFRVDRFSAFPWPGVREVLNEIQANCSSRIVVITGRPAGEIAPLLALDQPFEVWGLHGFERLYEDGRRDLQFLSPEAQQMLDELHEILRHDAFGGLFEAKPNAAVMHWRGLEKEEAQNVELQTRALFEPIANHHGFRLLPFEAGIELRIGRDKGEAVRAIMEECEGCGPAAFLGDDLTDEAAFRAIKGPGLGLLVRNEARESCADVWLKPPDELLDFLKRWCDATLKQER